MEFGGRKGRWLKEAFFPGATVVCTICGSMAPIVDPTGFAGISAAAATGADVAIVVAASGLG